MKAGNVLLGAIAGLAAGAVLGILFAPDKGTETRKKVSKKGKEVADNVTEKYNDVVSMLATKLDTVKNDGMNYFENGKTS